jgi:hypothetical protein
MLAGLLAFLSPTPVPLIRARLNRNPTAPDLPAQAAIAAPRGLRPGFTGRTGSESDFAAGQGIRPTALPLLSLARSRVPTPPGYLRPNLPPRYYTGPVLDLRRDPWGGSTRGRPLVRRATLLEPTYVPPLPRDVAAAAADRASFAVIFATAPEGF